MAPVHIDTEGPARAAIAASTLVRNLAAHAEALTTASGQPELARVATTLGSLADHASTTTQAIEQTLTTTSRRVTDPTRAPAINLQLKLTDDCVLLLTRIVDLASEIYAALCASLSDHFAIVEEHTQTSVDHGSQPLAATLGAVARALSASQATAEPRLA